MNDDQVVAKILKLLENNTAFIGYALNGGIGTKINVRNTDTGKTIQALSINVDSTGEVLVVKDSEDNQYKAVTFKTAEKVSERIIQLRKTKPIDDKKTIEYTDSDIEVFYLFVKLIDTGSPVPTQLISTWIRKGSSCTQFVGAYERCNYASKATIGGVSYTGLPYVPYTSLQNCLNDDLGRDAKTPHGDKDSTGMNPGWRVYSTKMTATQEQNLLAALTSHDNALGTNYKKLFGYGSILECSGAMYVQGWYNTTKSQTGEAYQHCEFSYFPGFTNDCSSQMQTAGYCDSRGFISSKAPLPGQEAPGQPSVGNVQNDWGTTYGWKNLPYEFMYKRHFFPLYLNGQHAQGSFLILEGLADDQNPTIPEGYFPWEPGCPSHGQGGPYDGSGGNRFPDGPAIPKKRDMKLSTHKAEIWLGSNKKTEAIKLYELGASDLFSGMYNAFIIGASESQVDIEQRLNRGFTTTFTDQLLHNKYYENRDKNIIDLRIDPRVWIYIVDNVPYANYARPSTNPPNQRDPWNSSLQQMVDNLYNRTINLTIVDKKTQVIHLKFGLTPRNILSNTDCRGSFSSFGIAEPINDLLAGESWEYQKYVTITVKDWKIDRTSNTLDTTGIPSTTWNKEYIERKFFTFFSKLTNESGGNTSHPKDNANSIILRPNSDISLSNLLSGNNYEQYNYNQASYLNTYFTVAAGSVMTPFPNSASHLRKSTISVDSQRFIMRSTSSWWSMWDKTRLDANTNRLNSIVGFEFNAHQILTSYGLNPNLNYDVVTNNNREVSSESYYEYVPSRPKVSVPSAIKSARAKTTSSGDIISRLVTRESILKGYGLNYFFTYYATNWTLYGSLVTFMPPSSRFYSSLILNNGVTREQTLLNTTSNFFYAQRRLDTRNWFNRLWAQMVYQSFVNVDVDSYKDVNFTSPTNPTRYIKYVRQSINANAEYSFSLETEQILETVLSAGTLDITKQVKITKPTNVTLDPNYSFLVYMLPNVAVTKKTKTI